MVVILSGDDDGWYYVVISRYILVDIYRIYAYRELSYRFSDVFIAESMRPTDQKRAGRLGIL